MERIHSIAAENLEVLDEKVGLLDDVNMLSSSSFKGSDVGGNESAFYEKFILDDLDNYWDELNDRLTVSRMVSDSVIKGMVNAVIEEAAEKIASKEEEIANLNKRLQCNEFDAVIGNMLESLVPELLKMRIEMEKTMSPSCPSSCSYLDAGLGWNNNEHLGRLRITAEEQLQNLKEDIQNVRISKSSGRMIVSSVDVGLCSVFPQKKANDNLVEIDGRVDALRGILSAVFEQINCMFCLNRASMFEQQWEYDFQREINYIVTQNFIKTLHDEYETKLDEQRSLINTLNMNWQQNLAELSTMREDLDAISKSLFNSETGQLFSHNSLENFEDWNTVKKKDQFPWKVLENHHLQSTSHAEENGTPSMKKSESNGKAMPEVADFSQLKHMSKEELVTYYKIEMTKMRRQHESALQEKTEELFSLKREFLKEKGSSLFRKDKEFELLKKKIPEVIFKLDDILLEKERLRAVQNDHDELCNLKSKIDKMFLENQRLQCLLTEKRKEVKYLSSRVSDATSQMSLHSSVEARFLKQIQKIKANVEDVKIVANIKDQVYDILLKDIISGQKYDLVDIEIENNIVQEVDSIVVRGWVGDVIPELISTILKSYSEKASLETLFSRKENALCTQIEENEKLEQAVKSLTALMKEKEKFASDAGSALMQQQQQFDLVNRELAMLRDQVVDQGTLISKYKMESDLLKSRLDEAIQKIYQYEMEMAKLSENSVITSNALEEAEKQQIVLREIVQENEKKLLSLITKEKQHSKQMNSIISSVKDFSGASADFESKLLENIVTNENRLKILSHQCSPLVQQAKLLMKKELWYKQMLEIRYSNLQKAEAEVDLLGDEVDALVSLLGKIYIALDHYSPVLQHYPGVMEILKLVRRELEGETTR